MPKVAYLFERFPSFGQTFCYREVAELDRQGVDVHIYSIRRPSGEPKQDWNPHLVERVHYLPEEKVLVSEIDEKLRAGKVPPPAADAIRNWDRQPDFLRLYQAAYVGLRLREAGLNHIHAHFAGMASRTAYWIEQFFGIPFSFTAHANDIFAPRGFVVSLARLMEKAAAIITVSDFAAKALREQFPQSAARIHRVYNGVDLARFHPSDFGSGTPSIVSVGRLIEKKGYQDLVAACGLLRERGRRFHCLIIGEGPLEQQLREQIHGRGLEEVVSLVGPETQSQIALRLAHATIFVLPCAHEQSGGMDNLPTVIMEAMAAGLPVISTPIAGVPEMVEDGVNGILVPEHDPAAISSAIEQLISDPEQARRLGDRGREIARKKFSIETTVRALRQVFET